MSDHARVERSAPTVVFVPGFMQRGEAWRPVAERIETSYRTTCLEHRAATLHGRLEEIAAAVERGDVLVGYSMGGRLALHAALRRRHVLGALVVVGASAGIEEEGVRAERRAADERLADWMEQQSIDEIVARWESLPVFASQTQALRDLLRPGRLAHRPEQLASLLRSAGQGAMPPVWDRLSEIACPVLAVAGEADDAYVEAVHRLAAQLPRGTARLIPGAGHAPQLETPDGFAAALLEFLDRHFPR